MCLKGFQGYGYDENFTKNMTKVNSLRKRDTTIISLTNQPDDICKNCPNLKNDICETSLQNKKITCMDNEVLKKLDSNKEYKSAELFKKIDEIFSTKESVEKICFECKWSEKCLFYQKLL